MRAQAHLPVHTAPELCLETPLNAASYVSKTDFAGWDRSQNVDGLSQKHSPLFFSILAAVIRWPTASATIDNDFIKLRLIMIITIGMVNMIIMAVRVVFPIPSGQ